MLDEESGLAVSSSGLPALIGQSEGSLGANARSGIASLSSGIIPQALNQLIMLVLVTLLSQA